MSQISESNLNPLFAWLIFDVQKFLFCFLKETKFIHILD